MKKLFKTEQRKEKEKGLELLVERTINFLIPELSKIKYSVAFQKTNILGTGLLVQIFPMEDPNNTILVVPWVRPEIMTRRELSKSLADYPRLNIHSEAKTLPDNEKIKFMLDLTKKLNLYFIVIIPNKIGGGLFWLDKYTNIPKDSWKLTYRKNTKTLDRIHLPVYKHYKFVSIKELKLQLNEIFEK